jgi:hypothetical protein
VKWALAFGLALGLLGCEDALYPSADADVDARVARLREGSNIVPAPPGFDPMPLATGQWAQYRMVDERGQRSVLTYKVIGKERGAYWIETLHETHYGRTAQKMLLAFGSRVDPHQIEVRAVVTLDRRGNVSPVSPTMIPVMQVRYRNALSAMAGDWMGTAQESAIVPAGRFLGCYRGRTDAQWGPWRSLADSWRHPAVPLSGLVRSKGIDHPFTMDLIAFGTSGATPDF